jgi:hypothetical protein
MIMISVSMGNSFVFFGRNNFTELPMVSQLIPLFCF